MINKKNILFVCIFFLNIFIYSSEINVSTIYSTNKQFLPFSFIDSNKIISCRGILNIIDIKNNKIVEKRNYREIIADIDCLNNKVLLTVLGKYRVDKLCIYDIESDKISDISNVIDKEHEFPKFWDFYGNNEEIIYSYYKNIKYENNNILRDDYGIYKKNIKTGKNTLIINNADIIDYNKGLLLYFTGALNSNEKKIYLYDEKQNISIQLDKLPNELFKVLGFDEIKIFKKNKILWRDVNGLLKLIDTQTGNINKILLNDNISSIGGIKYNFDADLIALEGYNYNDKKNSNRFIVIKIFLTNFYNVRIENLRFRESPTLDGKFIRLLVKGEKLELIEKGKEETVNGVKGSWLKVKTEKGEVGWAFDAYLQEIDR